MNKDEMLNYTLEVDLEKEWWDDFWWSSYHTDWNYDNCTESQKRFIRIEMGVGEEV